MKEKEREGTDLGSIVFFLGFNDGADVVLEPGISNADHPLSRWALAGLTPSNLVLAFSSLRDCLIEISEEGNFES